MILWFERNYMSMTAEDSDQYRMPPYPNKEHKLKHWKLKETAQLNLHQCFKESSMLALFYCYLIVGGLMYLGADCREVTNQ